MSQKQLGPWFWQPYATAPMPLLSFLCRQVKSMHRVDAVGNLLGVRRELTEGIESLLGWHKGVRQKKTETHRKIIGSKPLVSDGCTTTAQVFGWLTVTNPPRLGG
ncbi:hypothetical protein B296_00049523 [Ensete ventricosum]|uniref:Uncharacterized protein n=1 Tax=Ensete ventricosum TaxID=4639 RepID=A0A426YQ94_ENSVE|nr:hypothetical protein B296_00049523 [Ensete ventricosum]